MASRKISGLQPVKGRVPADLGTVPPVPAGFDSVPQLTASAIAAAEVKSIGAEVAHKLGAKGAEADRIHMTVVNEIISRNHAWIEKVGAEKTIQAIQASRLRLAMRLSQVQLFAAEDCTHTSARPYAGDHPLTQVIFQLRDRARRLQDLVEKALDPASPPEYRRFDVTKLEVLHTETLSKLAQAIDIATKEANKAAQELQQVVMHTQLLEQRRREHEDKMALARGNLDDIPDAALQALAEGPDA